MKLKQRQSISNVWETFEKKLLVIITILAILLIMDKQKKLAKLLVSIVNCEYHFAANT